LLIAVYIGITLSVYNFNAVIAPSFVVTLALTPGISAVSVFKVVISILLSLTPFLSSVISSLFVVSKVFYIFAISSKFVLISVVYVICSALILVMSC